MAGVNRDIPARANGQQSSERSDPCGRVHAPGFSSAFALRGRVVTPGEVIEDGAVVIEGARIAWVGPHAQAPADAVPAVAAAAPPVRGRFILPGLVDLHCHGGGGQSFPDAPSAEAARIAAQEHLRHGTTSLVGSLVTAASDTLIRQAAILADLVDAGDLVGIHLEGPFISPARCGAQNPAHVRVPDPNLLRRTAEAARGSLTTMTLAPELPGAVGPAGIVETLAHLGVVPSFGHTDCSAEQMRAGIVQASGILSPRRPTATHLFNGMRPIHHRDPGPVLACLAAAARGQMTVELVADGAHLAPATVAAVFNLAGPDSVALVTDAMAATGMPDGRYVLGELAVIVSDGVARLAQGGSIAGGTAHLIDVL
ncbi:MAG: amidohydrolase family protein, partial [Bifidobacteriaceae bacterium]|nr:amidohydrolase family protein [Bifidobacteriaceae bacterium]